MGKDATSSANDFTTDAKVLNFDKNALANITPGLKDWKDVQEAMQGGFKAALEKGAQSLTEKGTLPNCDISSDDKATHVVFDALNKAILRDKLSNLDMPKVDLKEIGEMLETERNAAKAADIIGNSDPHGRDLGNEAEQKELQRMFHEASEKGPEAVQKLVAAINKRLEGSGMKVDYDADHTPFSLVDGHLEVLNEHNQIIKTLSIPNPDSIYRKGLN